MDSLTCKKIVDDNCYILKLTIDGEIVYINDNFCNISGFRQDELIGKPFSKIKSTSTSSHLYENMWDTLKTGQLWKGIVQHTSKFGKEFFMEASIYPTFENDGTIKEFVFFGNDLTHYLDIITYDQLTGLKNRDSLKSDMDPNKSYACVIVNLDNFSDVTEFYGGDIGDKILIETAQRLTTIFKGSNLYRLQGDEFVILKILPNKYKKDEFEDIIKNKLKSAFEPSYHVDDIEMLITATSGISIGDKDNLRNANLAFKDAKLRNRSFSVYQDEMLEQFANFSKNKEIATDIKEAINQNLIVPYFQPIVDNKTGQIVKYEALARLIKNNTVVSPGAFLDISKKIKYYHRITREILVKSFECFGNKKDVGVSINLTIEDISSVRTFNLIIELLSKNKYNENITFELVESDGIEDYDMFNKFVTTIKKFNAKISIDDFGTGYSNFSYLARIEPNFLKIDGSLIKNIKNIKDFDVVKAIINFAQMYNIKTVAEYVENEEIFILVKELGIDYSQGYFFGKPIAFEEIDLSRSQISCKVA